LSLTAKENFKLVFCGLPKTGTTRIARNLAKIGFKSTGWEPRLSTELVLRWHEGRETPDVAEKIARHDVFEDFPWPLLAEHMPSHYENTKFVLTAPSSDAWFQDFQAGTLGQENWIGHYLLFGTYDKTDAASHISVYEAHNAKFREKIKTHPDLFMEIDATNPDWGALLRFWRPRPIGLWISPKSGLTYRVLPKCGCSTIGHLLSRLETGHDFEGDIHGTNTPLVKPDLNPDWADTVSQTRQFFTFVRNPYSRIESCFWDKIMNIQPNGKYYREDYFHSRLPRFGFDLNGDPQANFSAFLRFVEDDIEHKNSKSFEQHYYPVLGQLGTTLLSFADSSINFIGHVETMNSDIDRLCQLHEIVSPLEMVHVNKAPRLSSLNYGDEELKIMRKCYGLDFDYLGYGSDPHQRKPVNPVDIASIERISKTAIIDALSV